MNRLAKALVVINAAAAITCLGVSVREISEGNFPVFTLAAVAACSYAVYRLIRSR